MEIEKVIEGLGYSHKEAKIYVAALQLEESTVTDIARKSDIPRSTVSHVLQSLKHKDLMKSYLKKRRTVWVPERPEKILEKMSIKQEEFQKAINQLTEPKLPPKKPRIAIYRGFKELERLFESITQEKRNICAIIDSENVLRLLGQERIQDFINRRQQNFLRMRMLMAKSDFAHALRARDTAEMRITRFFPNQVSVKNAIYFFYGNKVSMISLNEDAPMALVIEDENMAATCQNLFEFMWSVSK